MPPSSPTVFISYSHDSTEHEKLVLIWPVPIRNKNTRIAYYHAIGRFLDWCQRAGFQAMERPLEQARFRLGARTFGEIRKIPIATPGL